MAEMVARWSTRTGPRTRRRRRLVLSALFVSVALNASAPAAFAGCLGGDLVATSPPSLARTLFCELNSARTTHKLRRLRRNRRLSQAAQRHARDMLRRRYFSHRSPGGTTVLTRTRRAGYAAGGEGVLVGELLGLGLAGTPWALTPDRLVRMWLASPSHRRVLVSRRWRELGIGSVFFSWGPIQAFVVAADFGRQKRTPARVPAK